MVKYRRNKLKTTEGIFFITAITHERKPILHNCFDLPHEVIDRVQGSFKFELFAFVFAPDHFHFLLSPAEADYSKIIYSIKGGFSAELKKQKEIPQIRFIGKRHGRIVFGSTPSAMRVTLFAMPITFIITP